MNKLLLLLTAVLLFTTTACEKVDKEINKLLTFYLEDSQNIRVPGTNLPVGGLLNVAPVSVTTRSEERFKNENTRADLVKDVTLDKLTLTITDPTTANFDFLDRITIYISTDANDRVALAALNPVPRSARTIDLQPTTAKLDKYLKAPSYNLSIEAQVRPGVTQDITVRADSRFKVTADPL